MELTLKTDNEQDLAIILALAARLNIVVEKSEKFLPNLSERELIKTRIQTFKSTKPSSFGDAQEWQRSQRAECDLPFTSMS